MSQKYMIQLGRMIRRARERNGFSQEEIAEKLERSQQTISRWETGVRDISFSNLISLVDAMDCNISIRIKDGKNGNGT